MATATASPPAAITIVPPLLRTIQAEINAKFFERTDAVEVAILALLSGEHVFWLGVPGIAKSALALEVCRRIGGAKFFEILMDRLLPQQMVFGPTDIPHYDKTGEWRINVTDKLPEAHIAFLDEVGKAGPTVLNPLLELINERRYKANGQKITVPLISVFGASNEQLTDSELAAFWDRFLLRMIVHPIQEPSNFAAYLQTAVSTPVQSAPPTTIDLADLERARLIEVPQVKIPSGVIDTIMQLKAELQAESITPSDRRWKKAMRVLQANAYLYGRTDVEEDDLAVLRYVLWDVVEQIPMVDKKTLSLTSPLTRAAVEFQTMLDEINVELDSRKGQSVEHRAAYGGEAQAAIAEITKRLNDTIEKAHRKGRPTSRLDGVKDAVRATRLRVFVEALNMPVDAAKRAVGE